MALPNWIMKSSLPMSSRPSQVNRVSCASFLPLLACLDKRARHAHLAQIDYRKNSFRIFKWLLSRLVRRWTRPIRARILHSSECVSSVHFGAGHYLHISLKRFRFRFEWYHLDSSDRKCARGGRNCATPLDVVRCGWARPRIRLVFVGLGESGASTITKLLSIVDTG